MYTYNDNHLAYFVPNIPLALNAAEVLKEVDIGASSAVHGELICVKPCLVRRLMFTLTGEVAGGSTVAPIVNFKKHPTPLSSSNETVVGALTIPDTTAIGKVVYKDISPIAFKVGDSIEISHVIGTTGPTGMGHYSFECEEHPDTAGNNTNMVASA
jgi:hypothetical protein